jgi:serine/threonine protein kinase/tetratricopeptide (TPR) repeat protein
MSIFLGAIDRDLPEERAAYLEQVCGSNERLRAGVERLLAAHDRLGTILPASGIPGPATTAAVSPVTAGPGTVIGPYKLLQQIGEGGMGTVWMAEQTQPVQRKVALKLIKPGLDSHQILARFEAERQALALMDHPNIAKVLDAGTTSGVRSQESGVSRQGDLFLTPDSCPLTPADGRPYFVMELVKGVPVTKYCDEHRLTPRERLELLVPVCQAVQHAHQKGVIHRDLKPSNVLVALYDGKPVPKVIDFGVAKATGPKLTERTLFTEFGALVGTLEYMSPEQAELNHQDIDTRSDVYALGVLLYELLTGTTPLEKKRVKEAGLLEALRIIREEETPRPSTRLSTAEELLAIAAKRGLEPKQLSGQVKGELDWIVMKCLEKDRDRRYPTANGLALDLQRYLSDEPVEACPPSAWYRWRKFARRHKAALAVAAVILFFIVLLGGGLGWAARDQAARRAVVEQEITFTLQGVEATYRLDKLTDALATVKQAEGLLAGLGGSAELGERARRWRTDLEMAILLEEIRLVTAVDRDGYVDRKVVGPAFTRAFHDYGIDVDELPVEEAAERIKNSPIKDHLLSALDQWVAVFGKEKHSLVQIARKADSSRWRNRFRDIILEGNWATLKGLARDPEMHKQPPATVVLLAALLYMPDEIPLAVALLRHAQQRYPGDFWINHTLSMKLLELSPPESGEAVSFARVALGLRPNDAGAHQELGIALRRHGKLQEAVTAYRWALNLKPGKSWVHLVYSNLGNALHDQGKLDEALEAHRQAVTLNPDSAAAHCNLGVTLRKQGKLDEAIVAYRRALDLKTDYSRAHFNLGNVYRKQGKQHDAIKSYLQALKCKPDYTSPLYHAGVFNNLGNAYRDTNELARAAAAYREALKLDGKHTSACLGLGITLHRLDKLDEAIQAFRQVLKFKPDFAEAHHDLALSLQAKGLLDEAILEYRAVIALLKEKDRGKPGDAELQEQDSGLASDADRREKLASSYTGLGVLLKGRGRVDQAEAAYQDALAVARPLANEFPRVWLYQSLLADIHGNLAVLFKNTSRPAQAEESYMEAIAIQEQVAAAEATPERFDQLARHLMNLGNLLKVVRPQEAQGHFETALGHYRRLTEKYPKHPRAPGHRLQLARTLDNLAGLWLQIGQRKKAKALLTEAEAITRRLAAEFPKRLDYRLEQARACNLLAIVLDGDGQGLEAETLFRESIALYRQLAAEAPGAADYHFELGAALGNLGIRLHARGDANQARGLLEEALPHYAIALKANDKHPAYRSGYLRHRRVHVLCLLDLGEHGAAAVAAERIAKAGDNPAQDCCQAAALLARCVTLAASDQQLAESERKKMAAAYGDRAMALLRQAVKQGWRNGAALQNSKDLEPLRARVDFKELIEELDARQP